ncbi:MAG TPA: hypothetical protein PLD46_07070, partial [Hyphomicrobium sp.]|nr:hypothetical protein [Hyphomicrobium sp.]
MHDSPVLAGEANGDASDVLLARRQGAVCVLTLNRAGARNALSIELIAKMHVAIISAGADAGIAAIVLAAINVV